MDFSDFNITIVGLGALGGSLAMAISEKLNAQNVWGIDLDEVTLQKAKTMGIIKEGYQLAKAPLSNSDIVFLCIYPQATITFLQQNLKDFKRGALIIETTGIKTSLMEKLQPIIPTYLDLIFGHPMAGRESKGLAYASGTIFQGASFLLSPTPQNKPGNLEVLKEILVSLGFAKIRNIEPAEHDALVAFTSHLPHIIASSLMLNPALSKCQFSLGTSFQDATRVARINSTLWTELLIENGPHIIKHLDTFIADLENFKEMIGKGDVVRLREALQEVGYRKENIS